MFADRRIPKSMVLAWGATTTIKPMLWSIAVYGLYAIAGFEWMRVPFVPLSVMGIAVSFYGGFKNNSAYDRFWEGRKIWGGVVNESRSWASAVLCHVRAGDTGDEAQALRQTLIYRHLAWTNALRLQLRGTSRFHHQPAATTKRRLDRHDSHMRNDWDKELTPFLSADEHLALKAQANPATHLVHNQGMALAAELQAGKLDLFHQLALMEILRELYALQGKAERIKKTPLPRQYAEFSRIFTRVFVYTVPFGLLDVFKDRLPAGMPATHDLPWLITYLAAAALISWVFLTMEGIGDSSEDPFERSMNDVPMNALCRVIERDLRQLLGEQEIPPSEEAIDSILY